MKRKFLNAGKHKQRDKNKKSFRFSWFSPTRLLIHWVEIPYAFIRIDSPAMNQVTYLEAGKTILRNGERIVKKKSKHMYMNHLENSPRLKGFFTKQKTEYQQY